AGPQRRRLSRGAAGHGATGGRARMGGVDRCLRPGGSRLASARMSRRAADSLNFDPAPHPPRPMMRTMKRLIPPALRGLLPAALLLALGACAGSTAEGSASDSPSVLIVGGGDSHDYPAWF